MTLHILLQAGLQDAVLGLWPMVAILLVFYFFMIRPQQKKQSEQEVFMDNLKKGDEVVMSCGIVGRINKIEDRFITLETANKTFLKVTNNSISKEMTESIFPAVVQKEA